jgi:uncharacterized protein
MLACVVDGINYDNTRDYRPGRKAAEERQVRSPFVEAGITKAEIRAAAQALGLPNWDKLAKACLASRIPYGTPVTIAALSQVERSELALAALGIRHVRVRHHGAVARIEISMEDFGKILAHRERIVEQLLRLGYTYVTLDLDGYRTGSLNTGQMVTPLALKESHEGHHFFTV